MGVYLRVFLLGFFIVIFLVCYLLVFVKDFLSDEFVNVGVKFDDCDFEKIVVGVGKFVKFDGVEYFDYLVILLFC